MLRPGQFAETSYWMLIRQQPDDEAWDRFVAKQPNPHLLQTAAWGCLKSDFGWWQERIALADESDSILAGAQLLFRRLPILPITLAYLGKGPYGEQLAHSELWPAIHDCARSHNATFLKWEPDVNCHEEFEPPLGFQRSAQTVQPPRTILIDLEEEEAPILARMNQGTRRKIRKSTRALTIRVGTREDIPGFYCLLQETAQRNGFGIHPLAYYERAAALFLPERAALLLAEEVGRMVAGVMVFAIGKRAWYFYGASQSAARHANAGYGVQWAAMAWARSHGCSEYDLWGIPDEDRELLESQFHNRRDGLWGVYGFKRGWGGRVTRSVGAWDYVYRPLPYAVYRAAYALWRKTRPI